MNRREFLHTSAGLALSAAGAAAFADQKPLRVGLIGSGWYGKLDVFRLIQVAPVEVVSLCEEEASRFHATNFWGSRAIIGAIGPEEPGQIRGYEGETIGEAWLSFLVADQSVSVDVSRPALEQARARLEAVVAARRRGEFPARPSSLCRTCAFRSVCPAVRAGDSTPSREPEGTEVLITTG